MRVEPRYAHKQGTFFQNQGVLIFYFLPVNCESLSFSIKLHKKENLRKLYLVRNKHFRVHFRPILKNSKANKRNINKKTDQLNSRY